VSRLDDGHAHRPGYLGRAFAIGISLNVVFVAAEGFCDWTTNSLTLCRPTPVTT